MTIFTLTVSSKGQVTLPAELREQLGIETGTKLTLAVEDGGAVRLRKRQPLESLIGDMAHIERDFGRPIEQADIDAAIEQAMAEKEARSRS